MQIAIKGLTNDYAQYLQDKLDVRRPKIGEKEKREIHDSFRNSSQAELQESTLIPKGKGTIVIDMETLEMAQLLGTVESYQYGSYLRGSGITKDLVSEIGNKNTIDTPFGEMRIGVRFDEKTTLYLDNLAQLAAFDTNNDGLLTSNDLSAKNLVLIGYDKDGAEVEMSLLDVLGGVELTQYFNNPKSGIHNNSFAAVLRPEESHEQLKKENILDFFKAYADKSGWIDFTNPDIAKRIFSENELDLSYRQKNADGTTRLKRIYFDEDIESLRKIQKENKKVFGWEYHAAKSLRNAGKDYVFNSKDTGTLERLRNGSMSYEHDSNLRRMNGYHPSKEYEFATGILNATITRIMVSSMWTQMATEPHS